MSKNKTDLPGKEKNKHTPNSRAVLLKHNIDQLKLPHYFFFSFTSTICPGYVCVEHWAKNSTLNPNNLSRGDDTGPHFSGEEGHAHRGPSPAR